MSQDRKYAAVSLCPKSQDILTLDAGGHPYQPGVCFQDGIRRVDYVLTYNVKKSCRALRPSLSITANGFFRRLRRSLQCCTGQPSGANRDSAVEKAALDQQEEEKRLLRDEFEDNLREMGLELEKDEHSKIPGVGFLKIHAPWDVLCREAEFLKLKMPTKEVYQATSRSKMVKLKGFIEDLTKPLLPDVEESRTHNPKHVCYPFSREKQHLFDLSDRENFFDTKTRGLIVFEVLKRTKCMSSEDDVGFPSLLAKGIYTSAYPLHDGDVDDEAPTPNDRKILYNEWASYSSFYKFQPIGLVRKYFGDKIGLYFAWLGLYTQMLIFASVVGVLVFLYGCITVDHDIPSMEICDKRNNITMCPMCDRACGYWKLKMACGTARASHLFDNTATVLFSVFMALWASAFMENWKRKQMRLNYKWDLATFEEEEESLKDHPRADYENKVKEKILKRIEKKPHKETKTVKLTWRDRCPAYITFTVSMLLMFFVSLAIVLAIVIYRVTTQAALQMSTVSTARSNVRLTVVSTAVIINLVVILILDEVYAKVAVWLTQLEVPKTDTSYEQRLIIKTFILKFLNSFSPIFYVAFMRGKLIGRPGKYLYVLGLYRMEECAHTGCLMELCIQLSITMLGKQLIQNNLFEIGIPKLKKLIKRFKSKREAGQQDPFSGNLRRYEKDHFLEPFGSLNPEYMEMIIQYGFVTLFVASFPLAPVFALLNNVLEIRLDAKKFIAELRRPVPARAKDIGIWYNILSGLSKVAIVVNAFVIAFTSDFIPRLVYQYGYSPDGTMHGFINHTLSYFNVTHFEPNTDPLQPFHLGYQVNVCRFKDYRLAPWSKTPYEVSKIYWAVLAARLAFVIIFQNVVMLMSDFVDWVVPDIPKEVTIRIYEEKKQMVEFFLKEEQCKTQSLPNIAPEGDRDQSNNQAYPQRL
uniref:Anoctamin n=1 Tax=Paramormyrops kingsleyae TaxID=1676925 RepID=A0A3B3RS37_9TELE|nr:anoctamin-1-like [Paramormyrops kingsleyae]XP_023683040.1 anoctamin-1-like [Paramormyrops kingsleyae]XP_023683041.1 anoctamin-1-like [Paramormyrops kingsleyae]XP_023683042.1 anoctamin-1-like [Paramormyrops kingsleyae]XP_023683043.1 anoctamin-1-like [Paramormyrops kingsleyae]